MADIQLPLALARDNLWCKDIGNTQLEFVVDIETSAEIRFLTSLFESNRYVAICG